MVPHMCRVSEIEDIYIAVQLCVQHVLSTKGSSQFNQLDDTIWFSVLRYSIPNSDSMH